MAYENGNQMKVWVNESDGVTPLVGEVSSCFYKLVA